MNKKLLLLALPALMVLSSCTALRTNAKDNVLMAEDTLAHEEIFGEAVEGGDLGLKLAAPQRAPEIDASFSKIGYQINFNAGGSGTADDTISIRFVLAIKDADVEVSWHRGLAQADGTIGANPGSGWKYKFNDGIPNVSSKIYTTLSNGAGSSVTANVAGDYAEYAGFAIYTLRNIPYEDYKDSYLAAYATITGSNTLNSQALAVKIERDGTVSKNKFYFDAGVTGHFLEGTINGALRDGSDNSTHALWRESGGHSADNYAWYDGITLQKTDSFGSFYYDAGETFQFFGHNSFFAESANFMSEASLSGYVKPIKDGHYKLFVSAGSGNPKEHENCVYTNVVYFNEEVNVWLNPSSDWKSAGARFATYFFGHASSDPVWRDMVPDGDYYKVAIPVGYRSIKFCRMNPDTSENNFNDGVRWTEGPNISLTSMTAGVSCRYNMDSGWSGSGSFVIHS